MDRFAQVIGLGLLLAGAAVATGCSNSAGGGLITGTALAPADAPGIKNDDPLARPISVAWTSARAQRCGFYFDASKLRSTYLAYEAQHSNAEQLAKAQNTYDTTFKMIGDRVAGDPGYCTDRKGAEIKAELKRHLAGDFTPNLPQPKKVETCGFFGCGATSTEKWDTKKWWEDEERKRMGR
jgi:hypothetical protein